MIKRLAIISLISGLLSAYFRPVEAASANSARKPDFSSCSGSDLASYIGRPVALLQGKTPPNTRLVPKGNAMTMDVRIDRLTVIYAVRSGVILEMYCG